MPKPLPKNKQSSQPHSKDWPKALIIIDRETALARNNTNDGLKNTLQSLFVAVRSYAVRFWVICGYLKLFGLSIGTFLSPVPTKSLALDPR